MSGTPFIRTYVIAEFSASLARSEQMFPIVFPTLMNFTAYRYRLGLGVALISLFSFQQPVPIAPAIVPATVLPVRTRLDCASLRGIAHVICLADAFKATLTPDQLSALQLLYSKTDAAKWSNLPQAFARPKRVGLAFALLNETQQKAAKALLAAVLVPGVPNEGFDELEGNLAADDYLATIDRGDMYGAGHYYLAFLGTPSQTGLWELQYGGHHYAFANTYRNGSVVGVTPSFRGVEPMASITQGSKTLQPMEQERRAFAQALSSLGSNEQTAAKLPVTFRGILLGPGRDGQFPASKQGIRIGDLSQVKQNLLLEAIKRYVNDLDPDVAKPILAKYTAELADTYLAFTGSRSMEQPNDYVRLDGPSLWIEYATQRGAVIHDTPHPHSVWRDRSGDYGGNE